ncbi:hypothetical protein [Streptomyces sp. 8L]|uniref:hypothetical protein n=1 Tax=Streptomyces sp. 8L TaxID=2877242 RepID=UPI001CD2E646|nr:hypothetical protein [Streptomyces sp. 8L]MCA1221398.1 hypothetical protein [Streptomyces sp. 8L]
MAELLTDDQADALVRHLLLGEVLADAARELGYAMDDVRATARTHAGLAVAMTGRDPAHPDAHGAVLRADYLRLLALGLPPSTVDVILGVQGSTWRGELEFAAACDAPAAVAPPLGAGWRPVGFTADRTRRFLESLRAGHPVGRAAADAGVTKVAVYKRRQRDALFATTMDAARNRNC